MEVDQLVTFLTTLESNEAHQFYWSGVHPDPATKRLQAYGTLEEMLPKLAERNAQGFGIFIAINAIDTPAYDGGYARRRNSDVTRVRSIFMDWDDPNSNFPDPPLEPTMVVETSPRKFHMHWVCDDCPLDQFESLQRGVAQVMGSDPAVHDLARELRVPGFLHTKNLANPSLVRLDSAGGPRYSFAQLREAFPYDSTRKVPKFSTWQGEPITTRAALTWAVLAAHYPRRLDGGYNIRCPWRHEHTTPDSASGSTYWPPSEKNEGRGSYVCMHAHCQGRMVAELDEWMSIQTATFLA